MPTAFQMASTLEFPAITRALANDWVDKIGRGTTLPIRFLTSDLHIFDDHMQTGSLA